MVPSLHDTKIPIKEIDEITRTTGPSMIYRDKHMRYGAIKFSVRGRDMSSTIAEAQDKVNASVKLEKGQTRFASEANNT